MNPDADTWVRFKSFANRGVAEVLCARLEVDGVPARVEVHDFEAYFSVLVPAELAHRARWLTSQAPPSDNELEYLATGRLPDTELK